MAKKTKTAPSPPAKVRTVTVTIEVPVMNDLPNRNAIGFIQGRLKPRHGQVLCGVTDALNGADARTDDGRHVDSNASALRWLLEQISESVAKQSLP